MAEITDCEVPQACLSAFLEIFFRVFFVGAWAVRSSLRHKMPSGKISIVKS
jgi:hypothetical protein